MKTMHYMKTTLAVFTAITLSIGFAACSSDDDDDMQQNVPESEQVTTFDDLAYFQDAFVETDSLGNLEGYSVGEPIYDNDPTHLYIGVENIQEALEFWEACLAPDINRTTSADNKYSYTLTDEEGQSQGTVSFAPGTESGHVAEITTNATDLKHFKTVTFLLNSAWPFNSGEGKYRVGDSFVREVKEGSFKDNVHFVCVREKGNGVKPFYVGITKDKYQPQIAANIEATTSKYCPGEAKAKLIHQLLHKDWEFFVACFEDAGGGLLDKDEAVWFDKSLHRIVYSFWYGINLTKEEVHIDRWDTTYRNPKKRILFKIDWEDE